MAPRQRKPDPVEAFWRWWEVVTTIVLFLVGIGIAVYIAILKEHADYGAVLIVFTFTGFPKLVSPLLRTMGRRDD